MNWAVYDECLITDVTVLYWKLDSEFGLLRCVNVLLLCAVILGKSGVVPNIPPGVPPMLGTHQYIMSQGGLPYFQQPVYSYEDLQLLQQRIPHVVMSSILSTVSYSFSFLSL